MCQRALPGTRVEGEHRLGCTRQLVPQHVLLPLQVSEFDPLTFTSVIECEKPNNDLTRFRGCM